MSTTTNPDAEVKVQDGQVHVSTPDAASAAAVVTPATAAPVTEASSAPSDITIDVPSSSSPAPPARSPSTSPTKSPKPSKPKDTDFVPYNQRPFVPGTTIVDVPHMFDPERPTIPVEMKNHWLQFQLQPKYFGEGADRVIYYDAQDPQFYYMDLEKPTCTIWLLIKNITFHQGGYVKRRLVEESILRNIQTRLVNPNRFDLTLSSQLAASGVHDKAIYMGQPIDLPDAVIPRVGANVDYFGLAVMRQLESMGIKVFNPSASIEISRDKMFTHQVLAAAGIPIPKSVLSRSPFDIDYIEKHFSYPIILKSTSGSKGDAVWKLDSRAELTALISTFDTSKPIIFQEFLADTRGRDLRCFVIGNTVAAAMMRIASSGFKANVHQGGSVRKVEVGANLHALAVDTAQLCLLDVTGVDVLLDKQSYKICEVNSSPGFQGLEKATEVNVGGRVMEFVERWVVEARKSGQLRVVKKASGSEGENREMDAYRGPVDEAHRVMGSDPSDHGQQQRIALEPVVASSGASNESSASF